MNSCAVSTLNFLKPTCPKKTALWSSWALCMPEWGLWGLSPPFLLCKNTVVSSGFRNNSTYKQFNGGFLSPPFPFNVEPSSVVFKEDLSFPIKAPLPQTLLLLSTQVLPSSSEKKAEHSRASTSFPIHRTAPQRAGIWGLDNLWSHSFQFSHLGNPVGLCDGQGR